MKRGTIIFFSVYFGIVGAVGIAGWALLREKPKSAKVEVAHHTPFIRRTLVCTRVIPDMTTAGIKVYSIDCRTSFIPQPDFQPVRGER